MKVYTLNGKVLKNSANDKWLQKKQAKYILSSSMAGITSDTYAIFEGPNYPNAFNGNGLKCKVIISSDLIGYDSLELTYEKNTFQTPPSGPTAFTINGNGTIAAGTYNVTLANVDTRVFSYGNGLALQGSGTNINVRNDLSKIEIVIFLD